MKTNNILAAGVLLAACFYGSVSAALLPAFDTTIVATDGVAKYQISTMHTVLDVNNGDPMVYSPLRKIVGSKYEDGYVYVRTSDCDAGDGQLYFTDRNHGIRYTSTFKVANTSLDDKLAGALCATYSQISTGKR